MPEISPSKYVVQAGWQDVPHIDEQAQAELLASTPPWLREARTKGEPSMGAGAIYPIPIADIEVKPFSIGRFWKRGYALDVGWNKTAALWGAQDPADGTIFLYTEHYQGQQLPMVHAAAIRARGAWIQGCIDPAARGRSQRDGEKLMDEYRSEPCNLKLVPAINEVQTGLEQVWQALALGRLKIFSTLQYFKTEYRVYRRDETGKLVKKNDHLMDCFAADTLVCTDQGKRRIAELVGTEGNVVTVGGRIVPYRDCRMYGLDRPVVRLSFSDGSSLVCTPDHLFLSEGEWVEARFLSGRVVDTAVPQSIRDATCPPSSWFPTPSKSLKTNAIIYAGSIFRGMVARARSAFTSLFGSVCTVGASRKATTFTTKTTTGHTTAKPTSNSRPPQSTYPTTSRGSASRCRQQLSLLHQCGTVARRVANGIVSIMRNAVTPCTLANRRPAFSAVIPLPVWLSDPASVPTIARRDSGRPAASTMRSGTASGAVRPLSSTDMPSSKRAASPAAVSCLEISDAGRANVYCLTVPETAAFAVEGGIIAHNCMRYLWMTWDKIATLQAPEATVRPFAVADRRAGM